MLVSRFLFSISILFSLLSCRGHSEQSFYKMKELHSVYETDHKEMTEAYDALKNKISRNLQELKETAHVKPAVKKGLEDEIMIMFERHNEVLAAHIHLVEKHESHVSSKDKEAFQKMHEEHEVMKIDHEVLRQEMLEKLEELKVLIKKKEKSTKMVSN